MWEEDIRGSLAYAKAIAKLGIITSEEEQELLKGLAEVHREWETQTFEIQAGDEDIHTANERRLTELIGPTGKKLHTGRSRNDQVATDTRLWLVKEERNIITLIKELLQVASSHALLHLDILMAGYTHLQPAQPIRYSHWIMSHMVALMRDAERLQQ